MIPTVFIAALTATFQPSFIAAETRLYIRHILPWVGMTRRNEETFQRHSSINNKMEFSENWQLQSKT